eukprot:13210293-Alexandrium_andersonii.AAC.1
MSASLVGSEMCIRDSITASCPASLDATAAPTPTVANNSRIPEVVWGGACLLYTSDAADDM